MKKETQARSLVKPNLMSSHITLANHELPFLPQRNLHSDKGGTGLASSISSHQLTDGSNVVIS